MTIKTLEHIHNLLLAEEQRTKEIYNAARKLQHEYEDSESAGKELVKSQTAAADEFMMAHLAAAGALAEFESREW